MIETIGKSDYSLFTLANSLITMFMVDFGLSAATARFVAVYRAEGNENKVNDFLGAVYKLYIIVDVIIAVILTVIFFRISAIYVKLSPEEIARLKIVYIIAAANSLVIFPFVTLNGILTAYEKFIHIKLADLIYRFLVVGLMVLALLNGFGLYAIVTVNAIASITVIIYKLIIIKSRTDIKVNFRYRDKGLLGQIFGFSAWVTVNTLAQRLIFNITPSILGIVSGSGEIAVFGIVVTIEGYVYMFANAINGMFMPKISRLNIENDSNEKLTDLLIKVGRFQFFINGLIMSGFIVCGKAFIEIWMKNKYMEYMDAYYGIIMVLIPGIFFNALQIANTLIIVRNKVKYQAIIAIVVGVINIAMSFVLSRFFGAIGACVSILVAYTIRVILYLIIDQKVINLNMKRFVAGCYLRMLPPVIITCAAGLIANCLMGKTSLVSFVAEGFAVCVVYIFSAGLLSLSSKERRGIFSFAKSIIKR